MPLELAAKELLCLYSRCSRINHQAIVHCCSV